MESTTTAEAEYAAFKEKVKRTVFVDNLSPHVTEVVIRNALNQFGTVKSVRLLPNYLEPKRRDRCALVEMAEVKQTAAVITSLTQLPFMVSGMPRPVRARAAEENMFDDRPMEPGRRIQCQWLDPNEPDFEIAMKLKRLAKKHAAEASFLVEKQVEREEELHKRQLGTLRANYKKYEMIEGVIHDRSAQKLGDRYGIKIFED